MAEEQEILKVAESSVKMAGSFLRLMRLENLQVFKKDEGRDVATNFDLESERLLANEIRMYFPDHKIQAEETIQDDIISEKDVVWYIDPLDGTKAFIRGSFAYVSLSVAARDSKGLIAAAIYNPFTDMLYSASRTGKMKLNGKELPKLGKVKLSEARILMDFHHDLDYRVQKELGTADVTKTIGRIFKLEGSIAQHLALIAQGNLDGAIMWGAGRKGHYWDIAGGILLLERQGVIVSDLRGNEILPSSMVFDQLIIATKDLHEEILAWLESIKKSKTWLKRILGS
ncbi:MAG: inositol monophosphatase family protein [Candidatus Hodarchaeales archaeon]